MTFFSDLAQSNVCTDTNANSFDTESIYSELDEDFTLDEILQGIKNLARSKSAGIDMLLKEYMIEFHEIFAPLLLKLFNVILQVGYFPATWAQGVVVPLHTKGDTNNVNNYRGITLLSHVGKLFTSIINTRLLWSDRESIVSDAQFGFRPGVGTRDAIFVLQSFDSVSHKNCGLSYANRASVDELWLLSNLYTTVARLV